MAGNRTGRRRGETQTRDVILEVARRHFADYGYRGVTIRGVARDAGVDPALVHHFFGRKIQLFEAALKLVAAEQAGEDEEPGRSTAARMLARWQDAEQRRRFLVIVRAVVNEPQTAPLVRRVMERELTPPGTVDVGAQLDAVLFGMRTIGIALMRHVVGLPVLVAEDTARLAQLLEPVATATPATDAMGTELASGH